MRKRFLYYLPGASGCNETMMVQRGLHSRFAAPGGAGLVEHVISGTDNGPAGTGCIVALGSQPAAYVPARQVWVESEGFWVGMDTALPPGPDDLVREIGLAGYEVELAGNIWRAPALRVWNGGTCEHVSALPKSFQPVNGKIKLTVSPAYAAQDAIAEEIWQSFLNQEVVSAEKLFKRAAALLAMNYRIGPEECALLGLVEQDTALNLLNLAIDIPSIDAHARAVANAGVVFCEPTIEDEDNG